MSHASQIPIGPSISLLLGREAFLQVEDASGRKAAISLANLPGRLIPGVFCRWAQERAAEAAKEKT